MLKRVGDRQLPCGRPCVGEMFCVDSVLSIRMLIFLFVRKECISFVKCSEVKLFIVCKSPKCQMLSKACLKSNVMKSVYWFWLKCLTVSCVKCIIFSVASLCGLNAV